MIGSKDIEELVILTTKENIMKIVKGLSLLLACSLVCAGTVQGQEAT